ncbi:aldehyde dehydrogenase [Rhodoligotrophos defluvii]|uniref:aldehyde dehydrogenase n=1 Tax=Rhodoligotrophos defluvii TaxID=2561934 RepID=UPI0010C998F6|nr:aldehyde dehydrogenase [Rhodoligotrophos defluvii]
MTSLLQRYYNLVGGTKHEAENGAWIESFDPYRGSPWAEIPRCGPADVDKAVTAARKAFEGAAWRGLTASSRGKLLWRLADLIERDAEKLARLEVRDNGKLFAEMHGQLRYIPEWYRYFGGLADKVEGSVIPTDKADIFNYTLREPLGVVAAITPWNSPLLLLTWKLAPALAAGNTVVIKPSEHASVSTLAFVDLFEEAGFPPGVVNTITGFGRDVGDALVAHPLVAKVAFTGGDATGAAVAAKAGEGIKHVSLELGGKSANIVFEDAAIDDAVRGAIAGIFAASGQTCIAGSRLLVQRSIHDEFVAKLVDFARPAKLGDPMEPETNVGPVTTTQQLERVLRYIDIGRQEGAKCMLGGGRPKDGVLGQGWFVEPTIFTGVENEMRIAQEEIFGPVLSVIPFDDDEDAVRKANQVAYGLAAGLWTRSMPRAIRLAARLEAGTVWVNTYRAVSYTSPFGGYKRSGLGRESGKRAIEEYLQTKSVWISCAEGFSNPFVMR